MTLAEHAANQKRLLGGLERKERAELARLREKLALSLGDQPSVVPRGELPAVKLA